MKIPLLTQSAFPVKSKIWKDIVNLNNDGYYNENKIFLLIQRDNER